LRGDGQASGGRGNTVREEFLNFVRGKNPPPRGSEKEAGLAVQLRERGNNKTDH